MAKSPDSPSSQKVTGDARTPGSSRQNSLAAAVPKALQPIFSQRPVAWYENKAQYDSLLREVIAEIGPTDIPEFVLVKDIVDIYWEMLRLKTLRTRAIEAHIPEAVCNLIRGSHCSQQESRAEIMGTGASPDAFLHELRKLARASKRKSHSGRMIRRLLADANVDDETLRFEAYRCALPILESMENQLENLELRRSKLMREIAERRRTLAAHTSSLIDREGAAQAQFTSANAET